MHRIILAAVASVALFAVACSKVPAGEATDSLIAKNGIPDDSIKPKPAPSPVLKPAPPAPVPLPYPNNGRTGIPDDSVKPAPAPTVR